MRSAAPRRALSNNWGTQDVVARTRNRRASIISASRIVDVLVMAHAQCPAVCLSSEEIAIHYPKSCEVLPAQPVDATPSDLNLFSKWSMWGFTCGLDVNR